VTEKRALDKASRNMSGSPANPVGRPSQYTPELGKLICKAVSIGHSKQSAAWLVGVHPDTVTAWQRKHPEFDIEFHRAIAHCKEDPLKCLWQAVQDGNNDAALKFLSRRFPKEFGGFSEFANVWEKTDEDLKLDENIDPVDLTEALSKDDRIKK